MGVSGIGNFSISRAEYAALERLENRGTVFSLATTRALGFNLPRPKKIPAEAGIFLSVKRQPAPLNRECLKLQHAPQRLLQSEPLGAQKLPLHSHQ